jgi:dephospho-CoA kinase
MKIVALTGSIGMGKSTTALMFSALGVPVWDADAAVHRLYGPDGAAISPLKALFPYVIDENGVNRALLADALSKHPEKLKQLEAIVHPLVGVDRADFLNKARQNKAQMVLLDIPLLFETGGDRHVDATVVVTCPPDVQKARVLARPMMSLEKFNLILARQMPAIEKVARADFVIDTSLGLDAAREQVGKVYQALLQSPQPNSELDPNHA